MYSSLFSFPGSVFGDVERLRRELDELFDGGFGSSIRSVAPGSFPAINVGHTPGSVEIYAFAPGLDPQKIELTIDRGVLTLAGERAPAAQADDRKVGVYTRERVHGSFRRAISLPEDADPNQVKAVYRDGVLNISIARRESAQPKRITVQ